MSDNHNNETGTPEGFQGDSEASTLDVQPKEVIPAPKKKKNKKKKKKGTQKPPQKSSQEGTAGTLSTSEVEMGEPLTLENSNPLESISATPETIVTLPAKPDEWFIKPAIYDENENLITEETFTFLQDGVELINLPLTETNFGALTELLNKKFQVTTEDTQADFFHIRKPIINSEDSNPVMTMTQRNRILATTELDQKTLKKLIKALHQHVKSTSPLTTWLNKWWIKHKIMRVLVCIAALPLVGIMFYSFFWGMTH